jgi:hypothetical protein
MRADACRAREFVMIYPKAKESLKYFELQWNQASQAAGRQRQQIESEINIECCRIVC